MNLAERDTGSDTRDATAGCVIVVSAVVAGTTLDVVVVVERTVQRTVNGRHAARTNGKSDDQPHRLSREQLVVSTIGPAARLRKDRQARSLYHLPIAHRYAVRRAVALAAN